VTASSKRGSLAPGNLVSFQAIEDEIRLHVDTTLFVAAAGTEVCRGGPSPNIGVIYPAAMPEVVAVTGVHADGTLHPTTCWGPEVALAVVLDTVPAPGRYPGEVVEYGGSSDAAAVVSGIAALVWSRFPSMKPPDIKNRLFASANPYPAVDCSFWAWPGPVLEQGCHWGHGSPDAYAAVAGVPMPNVVGLLKEEAISTIQSAGLAWIQRSVGDCNNTGYVINQSPQAGTLVAPDRSVTITVAVPPATNRCP